MEKLKRIAIHSVPRSGSTWLGSIFDSHPNVTYKLQPLFSYAFKNKLNPSSTQKEINDFFSELAISQDDFLDQSVGKEKGFIPNFTKERPSTIAYKEVRYHHILANLMEKDQEIKIIGLIRNPISVIYSWWKAPKEFRAEQGWRIEEEWQFAQKKNLGKPEEFNGYEKWKEATLLFQSLKRDYPDRFFLVTYDELINNTEAVIKELFEFVDLRFSKQTECFLQESRSQSVEDAYAVYKSKERDDLWKGKLPPEIVTYIQKDLENTALGKYLT